MIVAVNGMIVLTLSVSFILTVLQTTMAARGLAVRINALTCNVAIDDRVAALRRIGPLGADFCMVAVKLSASPLPGMFVPSDPMMNFPGAVARVCDLRGYRKSDAGFSGSLEDDTQELEAGLRLLGHHVGGDGRLDDVEAARARALQFSLPHEAGTERVDSHGHAEM